MGTKEIISNNYMVLAQKKFLCQNFSSERAALITGAFTNNIGEVISDALIAERIKIKCIDRKFKKNNDLLIVENIKNCIKKFFNEFPNGDILVVAHSDMQLKWYEDYNEKEISYIINNNLTSTSILPSSCTI